MGLGAAGDPPVEAGIVDQDDRVGPVVAKIAIGLGKKLEELDGIDKDASEPHHRQVGEAIKEARPGLGHVLAAEADALDARVKAPEFTNQVAAVNIAARLAGADENPH